MTLQVNRIGATGFVSLYGSICLVLVSLFIFGTEQHTKLSAIHISCFVLAVFCDAATTKRSIFRLDVQQVFLLLGLVFCLFLQLSISGHQYSEMLTALMGLITTLTVLCVRPIVTNDTIVRKAGNFIYYGLTIGITQAFAHAWMSGLDPVLTGAHDKNFTASVVYLYFCLTFGLKKKVGYVVCLLYPLLYLSRGYLAGVCVIVCGYLVCRWLSINNEKLGPYSTGKILIAVSATAIGVLIFSVVWAEMVSINLTSSYKDTLNDASNAMRFNSNVYAMQEIIDNPKFLVSGLDADSYGLYTVIEEDTDLRTVAAFNGFRLVQPHNVVLNLLLKHGLAFTLLYLCLIISLLKSFLKGRRLFMAAGYLAMGMFMHSLVTGHYLLLFVLVLLLSSYSCGKQVSLQDA